MATEAQLRAALKKAHAAGDMPAMKAIAQRLDAITGAAQAAPAPGIPEVVSPPTPLGTRGIGQAAATMLTGAIAEPLAGLAGIGGVLFGGEDTRAVEPVREALTADPGVEGAAFLQRFGAALPEPVRAAAGAIGRQFQQAEEAAGAESPAFGAAVATLPTALGIGAGGLGAGASRAAAATRQLSRDALDRAIRRRFDPEVDQLISDGADAGVPIQIADVSPEARNLQAKLENIPFTGARGRRAKRIEQARTVAEQAVADSQKLLDTKGFDDFATIQKVARGQGKRAFEAQAVIRAIQESGDNLDAIIAASGKLQVFRLKLQADRNYTKVSRLAGNAAAEPINAIRSAAAAFRELRQSAIPDAAGAQQARFLGRSLQKAGDMTFEEMRRARSKVLQIQRAMENNRTPLTQDAYQAMNDIAEALRDDMTAVAQASGDPRTLQALRTANTFYRNTYLPRKNSRLAKAVNQTGIGEPGTAARRTVEEVANQFFRRDSQLALETWKQLDRKGKAAVESRIFSEALDTATQRAEPGIQVFSPTRFSTALTKWGPFLQAVGQDRARGLANVMRAVSRPSSPGSAVATGASQPVALLAGGAGAVTAPGATAAIFGGVLGLQRLLEMPAANLILKKAARTNNRQALNFLARQYTALATGGVGAMQAVSEAEQ